MKKNKGEKMKKLFILIAILGLITAGASAVYAEIEVEYDRFKDLTTITFHGFSVGSQPTLCLRLEIAGKDCTDSSQSCYLKFLSLMERRRFFHNTDAILLVDGTRVVLGKASSQEEHDFGKIAELLYYSVSFDLIQRLAEAEKIEAKIGDTEFVLTEYEMTGIKECVQKALTLQK